MRFKIEIGCKMGPKASFDKSKFKIRDKSGNLFVTFGLRLASDPSTSPIKSGMIALSNLIIV